MEHTFVIIWSATGLELVVDLTRHTRNNIWNILKDATPNSLPYQLKNAIIKANAKENKHLCYEIYLVTAIAEITASDLSTMFIAQPTDTADLIRAQGTGLYSNRLGLT